MIKHYCDICGKQIIASCDLYTLQVTPINIDSIEFYRFECCPKCLKKLISYVKNIKNKIDERKNEK